MLSLKIIAQRGTFYVETFKLCKYGLKNWHPNCFLISSFFIEKKKKTEKREKKERKKNITNIHWSKQLKDQPVLLLSFFVHNYSINEHKKMKLRGKYLL